MTDAILEKIIAAKIRRVEAEKRDADLARLMERSRAARANARSHRLTGALSDRSKTNIIAEFKRASPSKGVINETCDPAKVAVDYKDGGACAISVLTEQDFFKGSLDDLGRIRHAVDIPVLRKDFIVDTFQIYEAADAGADAVLLIVSALSETDLSAFLYVIQDELNMDALVEVHTSNELEIASNIGATLIGVNNRDLRTFEVSLDVSRKLVSRKPAGSLMISESGIVSKEDMIELKALGFDGFLVGETLMRSDDPKADLEAWM